VKKNAVASPFNEAIYKFPFQIFMILEKMPVTFFTSEAVTSNHYIIFLPKAWKKSLVIALKYETATSLTYMVESTMVDTYNYDIFTRDEEHDFELSRFLRIDNYYSLFNRARYSTIESASKNPLGSSAFVYKNAVWLERELVEMYGASIHNHHDTRNLLLEYSFTENPLVKTYPTEGFLDIYYDFFRDQLCYVNHEYIEL
jgi:NADH:ubiquinone oxidoreductase subunit C